MSKTPIRIQKVIARMLAGRQSNLQDFACLAGWNTPTATDGKGGYVGGRIRNGKISTDRLDVTAQLAGWQTPTTSNDRKPNAKCANGYREDGTFRNDCRIWQHSGANAVNGFWGSADWLFCHDGKWRPVKPGLKPLVDGVAGRVGQLRAYGNAIVAPVAEAFISAYLESAQ
jgi:hypothetical protein